MKLNVSYINYGDTAILADNDGIAVMLSSTEQNLLYISGDREELYTKWSEQMSTISGVSCTM